MPPDQRLAVGRCPSGHTPLGFLLLRTIGLDLMLEPNARLFGSWARNTTSVGGLERQREPDGFTPGGPTSIRTLLSCQTRRTSTGPAPAADGVRHELTGRDKNDLQGIDRQAAQRPSLHAAGRGDRPSLRGEGPAHPAAAPKRSRPGRGGSIKAAVCRAEHVDVRPSSSEVVR